MCVALAVCGAGGPGGRSTLVLFFFHSSTSRFPSSFRLSAQLFELWLTNCYCSRNKNWLVCFFFPLFSFFFFIISHFLPAAYCLTSSQFLRPLARLKSNGCVCTSPRYFLDFVNFCFPRSTLPPPGLYVCVKELQKTRAATGHRMSSSKLPFT